jgi:hypothetical protein
MMVEPSARLLKVPLIGLALVLLMTVKLVPTASVAVPLPRRRNFAPLVIVTPLAATSSALGLRVSPSSNGKPKLERVAPVALEGETLGNRECARSLHTRGKESSPARSVTNCHRATDIACAAKGPAIDLHPACARSGAGCSQDNKRATLNCCAAAIGVRSS